MDNDLSFRSLIHDSTWTNQEIGILLGTLRLTNQDAEDVFELYFIEYKHKVVSGATFK